MSSALKNLMERWSLDQLASFAAEGNEPNVKVVNLFGRNTDIDTSAEDITEIGGNYAPPTVARVHAIVSSSAEDGDDSLQSTGTIEVISYSSMLAAAATGTITVVDWALAAIIKATGTITYGTPTAAIHSEGEITYGAPENTDTVVVDGTTFTKVAAGAKAEGTITYGTPDNGDTVEVNSVIFTKVASSPGALQFSTIANLTSAIDALPNVTATHDGTTITIVAAANGTAGNAYTLAVDGDNTGDMAVSGAGTLAGGVADPGAAQFATIAQLTALIQALPNVNATDNGTVITVVASVGGTGGDAIAMSVGGGNSGTLAVDATLSGGVAGDKVNVDGTEFECTDANASATQFTTISELTTLIQALPNVNATDNGTIITIEATTGGTAGNSIVLSSSDFTVSGAGTLAGGRAAAVITVNSVALTANVDFVATTDNTTTAENLKTAIHAIAGVTATRSGLVITITADAADETGNSIGLVTSVAGFATRSAATLAGGEGLCTVSVNGVDFVAGVDFTPGASNTAAAQSLKAAINASEDELIDGILTASGSGATLTITADTGGTAGDSITLVCADTDSITLSGAVLSGGDNENITGVRSVRITGVDSTYAEITEDIDLNGTGSKNTVNSYLRINSMVALAVGSNGSAVGNITATAAVDSTVSAKIIAGKCEAQNAYYTVPLNKTAFILSVYGVFPVATVETIAAVEMLIREFGKGWVQRYLFSVNVSADLHNGHVFAAPLVAPAKSDIRLRANTDADNADLIGGMQMLVVADA